MACSSFFEAAVPALLQALFGDHVTVKSNPEEWVIDQKVQYFSDSQQKWYDGSVMAIDAHGNIDVNVNDHKKTVPASDVPRRLKQPKDHVSATRLDLDAFHKFTLQRADVSCDTYTIEKEVAALSHAKGVELRASIWPGRGFHHRGGFWPPADLNEFLRGCVVVFLAGFNDARYGEGGDREAVYKAINEHVEWLKWYEDCEIAFTEVNDGHGNSLPWMTEHFQQIAARDDRVSVHVVKYPTAGWASDYYSDDRYHLSKAGLLAWLHPELRDVALKVAKERRRDRVLFVTDSTFQAHDYQTSWGLDEEAPSISLSIRTLQGEIFNLNVKVSDTIIALKEQLAAISSQNKDFIFQYAGRALRETRTLASYYLQDGATVLMRVVDLGRTGLFSNDATEPPPATAPQDEVFFVDDTFFDRTWDVDYKTPGQYKIALRVKGRYDGGNNAWLRHSGKDDGAWEVSFHGTSRYNSVTMAEHGYSLCGHQSGIYSTPDLKLAFLYAPAVRHSGKTYRAVVQNRVNPTKLWRMETESGAFWIAPCEEDIRPYGIILLDEEVWQKVQHGKVHGKGHGKSKG